MANNYSNLLNPNALSSAINNRMQTTTPSTGKLRTTPKSTGGLSSYLKFNSKPSSLSSFIKPTTPKISPLANPNFSAPKTDMSKISNPYGVTGTPVAQSNPTSTTTDNQQYYDNATGRLTPIGAMAGKADINAPKTTTGPVYAPQIPLYNRITTNLANQGNAPYNVAATNAITGLNEAKDINKDIGQKITDIGVNAGQRISDIGGLGARGQAGYLTTGTSPVGEGNAAILAQTTAAQQNAVAQGANTQIDAYKQALAAQGQTQSAQNNAGNLALTGQNTAQSALTNAGGLAQPQVQFGQLTDPLTGRVVGAGATGNNPLLDNAVNNAYNIIQNGGSYSDAISTIGQFGQAGEQALLNRLGTGGGNFSPTAQNAIAGQNVSQGQQYQGEAAELDKTLKQLDLLEPTVSKFIIDTGINKADNPFFNSSLKEYAAQLGNPADALAFNAMLADVKTYTAQILGASGLNPTEVSATVNSFNPENLSGEQLTQFLTNLKNLGQIRLKPLQDASAAAYGGKSGYAGTPAKPLIDSALGTPNAQDKLPTVGKIGVGALFNAGQGVLGTIGGLFKGIFK